MKRVSADSYSLEHRFRHYALSELLENSILSCPALKE
jgi:hypothetical protein